MGRITPALLMCVVGRGWIAERLILLFRVLESCGRLARLDVCVRYLTVGLLDEVQLICPLVQELGCTVAGRG